MLQMPTSRMSLRAKTLGLALLGLFVYLLSRQPTSKRKNMSFTAVESQTITVQNINVHMLAANNDAEGRYPNVVLLHGQAFQAATWQQTGTLETLGRHGVRAVAVDLPGHGVTGGQPLPQDQRGNFLRELLQALRVRQPLVLVTPSMSGSYVLPWLADHAAELAGWVAVAPVGLQQGKQMLEEAGKHVKLKVLAVYGERDAMRSHFAVLEDALPRAQFLLIPNAGHACYLDAPELFNRELLRFLDNEIAA